VITLYAITDHPTPPVPRLGQLRVIPSGDLAAVCGPATDGEVTAEALWQHERLVEALMQDRDVLPVRYGTRLPDDDAAARTLQDNQAEFTASLEAVRGAAELAVRVFAGADGAPAATPPSEPTTGTAYLRARARSAAAASDAGMIVHEPLSRAARAATSAQVNRPGELLRAAYLVDREAVASFSARVQEIQDGNPHLRITCTGPWPPYSFTGR
jgi:gas vesicle protein GvpL/GvpF